MVRQQRGAQALSWRQVNHSEKAICQIVLFILFFFFTFGLRSEFLQCTYDFTDLFLRIVE